MVAIVSIMAVSFILGCLSLIEPDVKLLVDESNSESNKCDDGGVVLHKTAYPFESGNDSEIPETFVKVCTEKVTSTDKVSKSYVYWLSFKFSIAAVFY